MVAARDFSIHVDFNTAQLQMWRNRFDRVWPDSFARAIQYALNEVAKTAVTTFRRDLGTVIDRPKEWTANGVRYKRVNLREVRAGARPYSETYVLPKQSAVLKYLMGPTPNTRLPGDVGPSQAYISLPVWRNLETYADIRPDAYGNLPSSSMRRIRRQANVGKDQIEPNPPNFKGRGGASEFFFGRPNRAGLGQGKLGFYHRPKRVWKNGRLVNDGVPHLLIVAAPLTTHRPILQAFWETNAQRAAGKLFELLRSELRRKIAWRRGSPP